MLIRDATPADVDTLAELRIAMFRDMGPSYEEHLDELDEVQRPWMTEGLADGAISGLIAEQDGVVAGGIQVAWLEVPPSRMDRSGRAAYLYGLRVLPEYRRQGIALALLRRAVELARERDVRMITLQASDDGRAVYAKLGFEPTTEMALVLEDPPGSTHPRDL